MPRVLVGIPRLELGGMQINALDMARAVRDLGHEVHLFAEREPSMPMLDIARGHGFEIELLEPSDRHVRRLAPRIGRLVRRHGADVIHAHGTWLGWGAFLGPCRRWGTPLVTTVYTMDVPHWIPRTPHLIVGTQELAEEARTWYRGPVWMIEPPVDTTLDRPGAVDPSGFTSAHDLDPRLLRVVIVSRLAWEMKFEPIERAIAAVEQLGRRDVQLVIVGEGEAEDRVRQLAAEANARLGRRAVVVTGALADPRPAYEAASLMIGQGGSAIRTLAFGKPLIVAAEGGFSLPFTESTRDVFFQQGFYGYDNGRVPVSRLAGQIQDLLDDAGGLQALGKLGRAIVEERYSLQAAGRQLERIYLESVGAPRSRWDWLVEAAYTTSYRAAGRMMPGGLRRSVRALLPGRLRRAG